MGGLLIGGILSFILWKAWSAYQKRKVPSIVMGGDGSETNTDAAIYQQMLNALLAKDLVLDPKVTK